MQFFTAAATLATLALSQTALAGPVPTVDASLDKRVDPHEIDFRTYGVSGCFDENQGVYTLELSDANKCSQFVDPIGSLLSGSSNCTLTIYQDAGCSVAPVVVPAGICQNGNWQSYELTC